MRGRVECVRCRQLLDCDEFAFNRSTRRRDKECKVCRHQQLARKHEREAALLLAARRRRRAEYEDSVRRGRAAAGRD